MIYRSTRTCPHCQNWIPVATTVCPACHRESPPVRAVSVVRVMVYSGLALILLFGFLGSLDSGGSAAPRGQPSGTHIQGSAIVWKSREDMDRGGKLIAAGVHQSNPELLSPLVSCFAQSGDLIATISPGMTRSEIVVTAGQRKGCTGWVVVENIAP